MKKIAAVAVIPLFAGFLWAQQQQAQQDQAAQSTTTTTTTWNGTLVDAGCRTTHTQRTESSSQTSPDQRSTTASRTQSESTSTDCPVTTTTTAFGLMTPEGKYVRFDDPSNVKIVEIVKGNKKWTETITEKKPLKVQVVGTPNGDIVVMQRIQ
jgi:hypothetical protein